MPTRENHQNHYLSISFGVGSSVQAKSSDDVLVLGEVNPQMMLLGRWARGKRISGLQGSNDTCSAVVKLNY